MSPLDDELRAALHGRATAIPPSPDPLAGIEQRARRIRRHRAATAIAGSALAVAAIALGVPALTPSSAPAPGPAVAPSVLEPSPSAPAPSPSGFAFDDPWVYRGDAELLAGGSRESFAREWAVTQGVPEDRVEWVPLFGEVYEPSGLPEVVYAARVRGSDTGVLGQAVATESGPEFRAQRPLSAGDPLLLLPVGGDEVSRLLAVAAPDAERLELSPDGTTFRDLTGRAPGVGVAPLEGDALRSVVRLTSSGGATVTESVYPDGASVVEPDNLLAWGPRGSAEPALLERAAAGYAEAKQVPRSQVQYRLLFGGSNDPGQSYALLQAWVPGQPAQRFGWVESPGRDPEPQLGPVLAADTHVLALLLTGIPGRTTEELVLVPEPGTGEVVYKSSAADQGRPVTAPGLDGVALVDREPDAQGDLVVLYDGNGDLDRPTAEVSVVALLCGQTSCG